MSVISVFSNNMIKAFSSLLSLGMLVAGCTGSRPMTLGVHDGKLAPCPATPNCVSSQSTDKDHAVEPFGFSGTPAEAMADLKKIISGMPRTRIVTATDTYLHAEFTSTLFRFVDDVEFWIDESTGTIEDPSSKLQGILDPQGSTTYSNRSLTPQHAAGECARSWIHLRSASRVGSSDLGVNRKRIEDLRAAMNALRPK